MYLAALKRDLPASVVVFLVALPLCLGIALASGAPLLSGVISGIIGGIVVGVFSKSHTSVSGPAAGLAAVVLAAIGKLGSFDLFLSALILAGVIQLCFGLLKTGFVVDFVPSNCGAVNLALQQPTETNITFVTSKIDKAIAKAGCVHATVNTSDPVVMEKITRMNAQNTIEEIFELSPGLKKRVDDKETGIVAAYYDTTSGVVHFEEMV
jgi:hypothetical protein